MPLVALWEADDRWAHEFDRIERDLRAILGKDAQQVDHIGSTSVPGLLSKDVIDVQVTVVDEGVLDRVASMLEERGWRRRAPADDHVVPGLSADPSEWQKALFNEPEGERRANVHIRVAGRANQRYALIVRDYLRTHPDDAAAYAEVKRGLATLAPDTDAYADAKDPACDLIYRAAEAWATEAGWEPSDRPG
jgi:GrpB-like predicted nucleotidyltransferase (UPF0157 family)